MKYVALCALLLVGCITQPLTLPNGPGNVIVDTDSTGVIFNQAGKDLWVGEGVPEAWFVPVPKGYHLTDLQYHQGNAIRLKLANQP